MSLVRSLGEQREPGNKPTAEVTAQISGCHWGQVGKASEQPACAGVALRDSRRNRTHGHLCVRSRSQQNKHKPNMQS